MAPLRLNTTTSITDFLKSQNKPSDFSSRESLYKSSGLEERLGKYVSSGPQNTAFLKALGTQTTIAPAKNTPPAWSWDGLPPPTSTPTEPPKGPVGTPLPNVTGTWEEQRTALRALGARRASERANASSIVPLEGGNIAKSITADQALSRIMGGGAPSPSLTPGMAPQDTTPGGVKPQATQGVTPTKTDAPAFGQGGTPTAQDVGLGLPGEAELADEYFNSPEYKALKDKYEREGLGAEAVAQTAKENLEAKYAADKAQLEESLGRRGLFMSGIRSSQVAALAQSLAMSTAQVDRTMAQKLLESDADFKADILNGIEDLFKEAKADNKEALGQLNQAGFALIGGMVVPTLAAQKYQSDEEKTRFTQELAIASFNQKQEEFAALERQRATSNAVELKRLGISMQNANTSAERNVILNQIRQISLLQKTAVSPGQIISSATGLPVKLTKEQTDYYAGVGSLLDTQIPSIQNLLTKVTTGGVAGRYMSSVVGIPILQNTLSLDQQNFLQEINQMNNSLIYLLSGKQINNQEFERLKMQLPSPNYTNSQNATQIASFSATMRDIYERNLAVNGFTVAGSENGQAATENMVNNAMMTETTDPLDELAGQFTQ